MDFWIAMTVAVLAFGFGYGVGHIIGLHRGFYHYGLGRGDDEQE